MKELKSDAGTPLRTKAGREVIKVKTSKGLVPFSVKKRNIDLRGGGSVRGVKLHKQGKAQ